MEKRVYYHDTDAGGVVYYGNYLKFLEESRTEFLEKKGLSVAAFHERGFLYAVSECNVKYRSPARYGDTLICEANLKDLTAVKLIFEQKIFEKQTKRLIVEAQVTLVCLNKDFKPSPLSEELQSKLR